MSESQGEKRQSRMPGCLNELVWLGAAFVLPCASLTFYRRAARRRVISAVLFFLLFSLVITVLTTARVAIVLFPVVNDIRQAFDTGEFPEITIQDGIATVNAEQPLVLVDEQRMAIILDTTGTYQRLDRSRYDQGLLLTRTELHLLNNDGRYQEIQLRDLHEAFAVDPIVVNARTVSTFWVGFSATSTIFAFLGIAVWNLLVRFAYVTMLALPIWGIVALFRRNAGFGPILIAGLYAIAPAVYAHYLLGLIGLRFVFLQTLIFLPMWAVALLAAFVEPGSGFLGGERPLRAWRVLIGVPLLLIIAVNVLISWPKMAYVAWPLAILTFIALVVVGLLTAGIMARAKQTEPETVAEAQAVDGPAEGGAV